MINQYVGNLPAMPPSFPIIYPRSSATPRGLRRIRSVGGKLAGVRRLCRCAAVPEEVLQTRHPFQHGQRDLPSEQLQAAGLEFDAIYTAEDIGSYKPSARNFEYMIEKLGEIGVQKEKILHTSESMFHNHKPANEHGLKSCWIYRRHA